MKIKLLLTIIVLSFFNAHTSQGQCPVVTYSIENVPSEYLLKGKPSYKALKILMTDTLKYYRFQIDYSSQEKQILGKHKFSGRKYKDESPNSLWHGLVLDTNGTLISTLLDLRYSWIPLDEAILNQSGFLKLKVSTHPIFDFSGQWSLIDTLCDINIRISELSAVTDREINGYGIYSSYKKIFIRSENLGCIVDKINIIDFCGKANTMKYDESSSHNYVVDAHLLSPGVFLLQIISKNGTVTHKKILIE